MARGAYEANKDTGRGAGFSIFALTLALLLVAFVAMAISYLEASGTEKNAGALYLVEKERQTCDSAIQVLMDGSDYLTFQVQQHVIKADRAYMDNYWEEVYQTRSRDTAIETILSCDITDEERVKALSSKEESDRLIVGETWAMRMICQSAGIPESEMPPDVAAYALTDADEALSAEDKQRAAIAFVFGPDYSIAKDKIRSGVIAFRNEINDRYGEQAINAINAARVTSGRARVFIIAFLIVMLLTVAAYTALVIVPLMKYSKAISDIKGRGENEKPLARLTPKGARELKQLAMEFNSLHEQVEMNTLRLERMGYIDFLTEIPNRASITEYIDEAIRNNDKSLGLMIIDIDDFKRFNDTFGHANGDRTLKRIARAISLSHAEGMSGRLCGEEFVVALPNATEQSMGEVARRILENTRAITAADVELPKDADYHVTVSIGGVIWDGRAADEARGNGFVWLLSAADKQLYISKSTGKDKYTFGGLTSIGRL